MRGAHVAATVIVGLLVASIGCGIRDDEQSEAFDPRWAEPAVELTAAMASAYDTEDVFTSALFFTAGGSLDLTIWEQGVQTTPDGVVDALPRIWWQSRPRTNVRAHHLFVSLDGAVVSWSAYDHDGFQTWAQTYAFAGNRTASRAFRALEAPFEWLDPTDTSIDDLASDYIAAWSAGDAASLSTVYADGATVRDPVRGVEWTGVDEIAASGADSIDHGPFPETYVYRRGGQLQAITLVQTGGECPMLEARRWAVVDDRIIDETRYVHVPSARRCLAAPPDGWWTSFEPIPRFQDNLTELVDVNGVAIDLVNAEPIHEEFVRWITGQFVGAGLPVADVGVVWFPPSPDCAGPHGLAIHADERFSLDDTVLLCYGVDDLRSDTSSTGWSRLAVATGFHELAHIWMEDHVDDDTREAFRTRAGLPAWRGEQLAWDQRAAEHAATTISWGLGGTADAVYPDLPAPECEELAARFELLTGRPPTTECGDGGWAR